MNVLIEVVAFAVAIGVLVVVHEYGHYSVARLCGVKVLRFSIGFGRPLASWVGRKTGTQWTISALPLGGYVKMLDERDTESRIAPADLPHAFNRQHVAKRIAIVLAGPLANFLLAIALFSVVFATGVTEPVATLATPPEVKRRSIALYYYTASKAVYREVPNLSTMYHARPGDPATIRREAAAFRANEYFKDYAPPVLFRLYEKIRWRLSSKQ